MTKKINFDIFVFLLLHIYRRHISPVRKMCPIPDVPLMGRNIIIFSSKRIPVVIFEKIHITESSIIFGKYLEPRKELTRFEWSKPL